MRLLPTAAVFALIIAFAVPGAAMGGHAGPLTATCTNPEVPYTVNFPNNWYYNDRVSGDGGPVEACRLFSPEDFEVTPGSEPSGISIHLSVENRAYDEADGEEVTVGGRQAIVSENDITTPGFEGTYYTYRIDLGDGTSLSAQTVDQWVGDYEENKQILDAMMDSLVFGTQEEPTATPTPTPEVTALPDAALRSSGSDGVALATLAAALAIAFVGAASLRLATARRQ